MSTYKQDESFDLLAHERKISKLYQNNKGLQGEEPSAKLDSEIMTMAKQQFSENSSLLTKQQKLKQSPTDNKRTPPKTLKLWQWPSSLVASVAILGILLITQNSYFIDPSDVVVEDTTILNSPIMGTPNVNTLESLTEKAADEPSFQVMQMTASAQKAEGQSNKKNITSMTIKTVSRSQSPKRLKEQILDRPMLEDNSAKVSPMSLSDMFKLAELLKLELTIQKMPDQDVDKSIPNMQQTLFEHLVQYQNSHVEFEITDTFLNVLTDKQVQQLTTLDIKAVTEN